MSVTVDEIVTAAIQLPESDRLAIVSRLLETMGEEDILQSVDDADFIAEMLLNGRNCVTRTDADGIGSISSIGHARVSFSP